MCRLQCYDVCVFTRHHEMCFNTLNVCINSYAIRPRLSVRLDPVCGWLRFVAKNNPNYPQQHQQTALHLVPDRTQIWFRCILAGQIPPKAPHKLRTPSLAQSGRRTRRRRRSSWGARVRRREGCGRRFLPCLPSPRQSCYQ